MTWRIPAIFLFLMLILSAAGCNRSRNESSQMRTDVAPPPPFEMLTASGGSLGWGEIVIGMRRSDVEQELGREISLHQIESPVCGEFFADVEYAGRTLSLQFSGRDPAAELESIFVPIAATLQSREMLVSALKDKLPNLQYQPSRHQPNQPESANRTPMYLLPANAELAILLKPDRGFYLSLRDCLD